MKEQIKLSTKIDVHMLSRVAHCDSMSVVPLIKWVICLMHEL